MEPYRHFIKTDQLQELINVLHDEGYICTGPIVKDGAILFDDIDSVSQLPIGFHDTQKPGHYSLNKNQDHAYFAWANGPQALKPFLFTPKETLWQSTRHENGEIKFLAVEVEAPRRAVIGVRACDIAALKLQDQHFLQQQFIDQGYQARRDKLLTIAVNCNHPAETCFCASTGDGPFVDDGYDIALTELTSGFLIQAQTPAGESITAKLELTEATQEHQHEAVNLNKASSHQQKILPQLDIKSRLVDELNNEAWHDNATKCLSCGNCTSVCPTCFCHSEHDEPELDGNKSSHVRQWDSCFTQGHSYIHGITIRSETSQRYRQWLTHKFSSWHDQYGRSGCVGCGRCISWCPVGIDVVESITKIVDRRHD